MVFQKVETAKLEMALNRSIHLRQVVGSPQEVDSGDSHGCLEVTTRIQDKIFQLLINVLQDELYERVSRL